MTNKLSANWKEVKLGDIGTFLRGSGIAKKDLSESGIPAIRYGDIYTKYDYVIKNISSFTNSKGTELKKGDILFAGSGETIAEIGKSVAFIDDIKVLAGGDIIIFRPSIELDSIFLSYMLNTGKCRKYLSVMGQGATIAHIYSSSLKELSVFLPPLDEQKRIASALSKIDAYLENTIKLIEEKERFKKGISKKLLTCKEGENVPEMRFKEFNDKWKEEKILEFVNKNIIKIEKGKPISESKIIKGDIPVIAGGKKPPYYYNKYNYDFPCVTISASGSAGYVWFHDYKIWASDCHVIYTDNKKYNIKFLYYYLKSIQDLIYHMQIGGVQKHIYAKDIMTLNIPNITIEEQEEISKFLSLLDAEIDNLKEQKEEIKKMKSGIIKKLMTGEVRL